MLRTLIDARALLATLVAAVVGVCGLQAFPIDRDNPFLILVEVRRPDIAHGLAYGYGLLWFSTPFWLASIVMSLAAIAASGLKPTWAYRPLPPYPEPEKRPDLSLVLGETHFADRSGRAPEPRWLQIPERGLYTGIMILGAVVVSWIVGKPLTIHPLIVSKLNTLAQILLATLVLATNAFGLSPGYAYEGALVAVGVLTGLSAAAYLAAWVRHMAS